LKRTHWQSCEQDLKIPTERENMFEKTSEMAEGSCIVMFVTDLNRPNTGKDGDRCLPVKNAEILGYEYLDFVHQQDL
jgi:hypothetical protein